jgi:diamine N-acetyltransferase
MVIIRDAAPADAALLAELAVRTFRSTFGAANSPEDMDEHCAENFGPEQQAGEIADPGWCTLVATEDGTLLAYGQLRRSATPECLSARRPLEIYRLYVDDPWHGRGVAQTLMQALIARAVAEGADAVWLGVWERNPRAIAFYRKSGFEAVGAQRFVLGKDVQRDVIMCRRLGN